MALETLIDYSPVQPGAPGMHELTVRPESWRTTVQELADGGARLVTLWAGRNRQTRQDRAVVHSVFLAGNRGLLLNLELRESEVPYPGIEDLFPAAGRLQRAMTDLSGLRSTDPDTRPWLRHTAWPPDFRPLVDLSRPAADGARRPDDYAFVRVDGDGVHEIPVGPVHAGIIEPGHFRFSAVGEKVLRLEERLGYVHKGIERRFTELPIFEGHRLAARVSGDSAVAYSWAYCQALEGMTNSRIPARAVYLRALCLELERCANHLGDLGALGNDAGFAFGLAQFSRLKEKLLRATQESLGARYLLGAIVPGGLALDLSAGDDLARCVRDIASETATLRTIFEEHEGVRDRFNGAGTVAPELAARLGLTGLAGRASGQAFDLRVDQPCEPYDTLSVRKMGARVGDVAARVAVRFDELQESSRLVEAILAGLPTGSHRTPLPLPGDGAMGIGLIEGWRGPVLVALEAGASGTIWRCHPHDPSWLNWPVIEHAIIGNIVPDFPLINKSFNLSYSGHDL